MKIKTTLTIVISLVGCLALSIPVLNSTAFDEALLPEVAKLKAKAFEQNTPDNGFVVLSGLPAASERDPAEVGQKMQALLSRKYRQGEAVELSKAEYTGLFGGEGLDKPWLEAYEALNCHPRHESDCLSRLSAQISQMSPDQRPGHKRLHTMLGRYRQVLATSHYVESEEVDMSSPLPNYDLLMKLSRMTLAQQYASGDMALFLQALSDDMRFWRGVLSQGRTLIAKMVATAMLWADLNAASTAMREHALSEEHITALAEILTPLDGPLLDISEAFLHEQTIIHHTLSNSARQAQVFFLPQEMSPFQRQLMALASQQNASINGYYEQITLPTVQLSQLAPQAFHQHHMQPKAEYKGYRIFPPTLYNLGGKILLTMVKASYTPENYIGRMHDLAGIYRLLALQLEMEKNDLAGFEKGLTQVKFSNLYDGKPMNFDRTKMTVGFKCFDKRVGTCKITL